MEPFQALVKRRERARGALLRPQARRQRITLLNQRGSLQALLGLRRERAQAFRMGKIAPGSQVIAHLKGCLPHTLQRRKVIGVNPQCLAEQGCGMFVLSGLHQERADPSLERGIVRQTAG